jgi:peptidoglycan/LPS O-acetylase OafA/YrhL
VDVATRDNKPSLDGERREHARSTASATPRADHPSSGDYAASRLADAPRPAYRPDIDGLRALSVVAVILFHFSVPGFRGGFVGVDIFFVISGYLITKLLVLRRELPFRQWLGEFYLRRARRILPALLLVLLVSAVVAAWLFAPINFRYFGKSLALSVAMLGNYSAEQTIDYFDASWRAAPLTHLWSIAVEEQFYLLYPLLLFGALRFTPRRAQSALVVIAVLTSFALCAWASSTHPRANYYLPITRAWELGLGALLGLRALAWSPKAAAREVLAATALAAIIVSIVYFNESLPFPGWYALLPCVGTAALIATGDAGGSSIHRMLAIRPLVFIGLISYALYLWHVPIKVFRDYYMMTPPGTLEVFVLLATLAVIAVLSWRWFEVPLRKGRALPSTRAFLVVTGVTAAALLAFGWAAWFSDGVPKRLSREEQRIVEVMTERPFHLDPDCLRAFRNHFGEGELCRLGTAHPADNIVVLWGDSHALLLLPAVQAVAERHGAQLQFATMSTCKPLMNAQPRDPSAQQCQNFNQTVLGAIERVRPRVVILAGYWGNSDSSAVGPTFGEKLEDTLKQINADGRRTCLVRDVPTFRYPVPLALAMAHRRGIEPTFNALSLDDVRQQQRAFDAEFDRLEQRGAVMTVSPRDALCASGACEMVDEKGALLYRDSNHLTPVGARLVEPVVEACFAEAVSATVQ